MANLLKVAVVEAIIGLLDCGWSYRRISRELGVHRDTVARYDRLRHSKPSKMPPGSTGADHSKPSNLPAGSSVGEDPKPAKVIPKSDEKNRSGFALFENVAKSGSP